MSEGDYWYLSVRNSVCEGLWVSEDIFRCLRVPNVSVEAYWCLRVPTGVKGCLLVPTVVKGCLMVSEGAYWFLKGPNGI